VFLLFSQLKTVQMLNWVYYNFRTGSYFHKQILLSSTHQTSTLVDNVV